MASDGLSWGKEGQETLNVINCVVELPGRTISFWWLARFSARLYPHLTALSGGGELADVSESLLGHLCINAQYADLAYCVSQWTA